MCQELCSRMLCHMGICTDLVQLNHMVFVVLFFLEVCTPVSITTSGGRYHSCDSILCHSSDILVAVLTQTHRRWNCKVGLICIFLMARDVKNLKLLVTCIIINTYTQRERQTRAHHSEIQLIKIFHTFCRLTDTLFII